MDEHGSDRGMVVLYVFSLAFGVYLLLVPITGDSYIIPAQIITGTCLFVVGVAGCWPSTNANSK